jgi:hypothetical protein
VNCTGQLIFSGGYIKMQKPNPHRKFLLFLQAALKQAAYLEYLIIRQITINGAIAKTKGL